MLFQKYHSLWFLVEKTHFGKHFEQKSDLFLLDHEEVFREQFRNYLINGFLNRNQISHRVKKKMDDRCSQISKRELLTNRIFSIMAVVTLKTSNLFKKIWQAMLTCGISHCTLLRLQIVSKRSNKEIRPGFCIC